MNTSKKKRLQQQTIEDLPRLLEPFSSFFEVRQSELFPLIKKLSLKPHVQEILYNKQPESFKTGTQRSSHLEKMYSCKSKQEFIKKYPKAYKSVSSLTPIEFSKWKQTHSRGRMYTQVTEAEIVKTLIQGKVFNSHQVLFLKSKNKLKQYLALKKFSRPGIKKAIISLLKENTSLTKGEIFSKITSHSKPVVANTLHRLVKEKIFEYFPAYGEKSVYTISESFSAILAQIDFIRQSTLED